MGSTHILLLRNAVAMTGEQQVKKKKSVGEDDTNNFNDVKVHDTPCEDSNTNTFSCCSKALFFTIILVSTGLAILSVSTNLNTFSNSDVLAVYGKESLLPNFQGLELDFPSVTALGS